MTSTAAMLSAPSKPPVTTASNVATSNSKTKDSRETSDSKDTNALGDQFSSLLQSLGFVVPTQTATQSADTSFGRAFNWDPAMLVVNAETGEEVSLDSIFPAELLQSLTPGLPFQDAMAAPMAAAPAVDAASALPVSAGDVPAAPVQTTPPQNADTAPLIATGLTVPVLEDAAALPVIGTTTTTDDGTPVTTVSLTTPPATTPDSTNGAVTAQSATSAGVSAQASASAQTVAPTKWFDAAKADITAFESGETAGRGDAQNGQAAQSPNAAVTGKLAGATMLAAQQTGAGAGNDMSGAMTPDAATATTPFTLDGGDVMFAPAGTTATQPGVQTATLTQTVAAGASHPSTQVLAAAMQAASSDKPKSFTLSLNPAELGRVLVDMKLDAEKKMKITLTVEKDTTFNLLQRDQQGLQGLLDKAGIAKDADVTFQLASDQQSFDQAAGDRGAFQPDDAPSYRIADKSAVEDANAALPTSVWQDSADSRHGVNRLV
jgi:flagellar hook-length control protein FliK